jgi:hypothetical protein
MLELNIYKAILHTAGLENEYGQDDKTGKELWKQIYNLMDGESALIASANEENEHAFLGLEDRQKNKELHYLIEQDDMIGVKYTQKEWDEIWDAGDYAPDSILYLVSSSVEILRKLGEDKAK